VVSKGLVKGLVVGLVALVLRRGYFCQVQSCDCRLDLRHGVVTEYGVWSVEYGENGVC
jgi:hypothetical protein